MFSSRVSLFFWFNILVCLICSLTNTYAQTRIEITKIPLGTPADAKIYLAGSFNNWKSDDARFLFQKNPDNKTLFLNLADSLNSFEYKFTRGSWDMTEGNFNGKARENRKFNSLKDRGLIQTTIESWEDFFHYTFIVRKIPKNTPHEAILYVAGNFNDWNPGYPEILWKVEPMEKPCQTGL
jgi:hypothetical protein